MKSDFAWSECHHLHGNGYQHVGRVTTVAAENFMFTLGMAASLCF